MGKKGNLQRRKKYSFKGNRFTKCRPTIPDTEQVEENESASARKLHSARGNETEAQNNGAVMNNDGYRFIYLPNLANAISDRLCCRICKGKVVLVETAVYGLSSTFVFQCENCDASEEFQSSPSSKNRVTEINRRVIYSMRCLGQGLRGLELFCGLMDLPSPVKQTTYTLIVNRIMEATKLVAEDSMNRAANEEVELSSEPQKREISISADGTWKTRGYTSRYGIASVIGAECGKVIDVEVKSSYCKICRDKKGPKSGSEYNAWLERHRSSCAVNHVGSAGNMECDGMLKIFSRSEAKHGVKYVEYIGDGDTKSFKTVHDAMPYGPDIDIKKIECVGHVQKRMGTRLRNLKKKLSGKKLEDGKGIGGVGRLTDPIIDKFQVYYGNAIRDNKDNLHNMRIAVWAIWYHESSTDSDPQHHCCPPGPSSWCGYRQAQAEGTEKDYKHPHPVPMAVMKAIKPVFQDLCATQLLERCLKGRTQNANESFNNKVWTMCPKTTNSGHKIMQISAYDSVAHFNDGNSSKLKILERLQVSTGTYARTLLNDRDNLRVKSAEKRRLASTKEVRKAKRRLRLEEHNRAVEREGVTYCAGSF